MRDDLTAGWSRDAEARITEIVGHPPRMAALPEEASSEAQRELIAALRSSACGASKGVPGFPHHRQAPDAVPQSDGDGQEPVHRNHTAP
jgi:hypothetical protein